VTRAVIFDCDGVLVDSEPISNRVLAEVLTAIGLPMTTEQSREHFLGKAWESNLQTIERLLGEAPPPGLTETYSSARDAALAASLEPVPGIHEALERIDLPWCVASSGDHAKMRLTLGMTGLLDRFEGRIFSATEVAQGKPAPDLYLRAAERMGFDPATTAVVEDSPAGVRAGVAAGMRVLAYAREGDPATLAALGGEVFDDMRALPDLHSACARARST
jgi:HAD superfamily hydrolase (TIGR01509 family)